MFGPVRIIHRCSPDSSLLFGIYDIVHCSITGCLCNFVRFSGYGVASKTCLPQFRLLFHWSFRVSRSWRVWATRKLDVLSQLIGCCYFSQSHQAIQNGKSFYHGFKDGIITCKSDGKLVHSWWTPLLIKEGTPGIIGGKFQSFTMKS